MSSTATLTRTQISNADRCEYFLDCRRPADGLVNHPILGLLHSCRVCAATVGLPMEVGIEALNLRLSA
jgi:hypothetical protein